MGQGDSARDFDTSESMKNVGILDVFPIFHTARLGQKIRRSLQLPLCGVALKCQMHKKALWLTVRLCWREHTHIGKAEAKRMSFITIPFLWEWHYIMTVQSLTHMT